MISFKHYVNNQDNLNKYNVPILPIIVHGSHAKPKPKPKPKPEPIKEAKKKIVTAGSIEDFHDNPGLNARFHPDEQLTGQDHVRRLDQLLQPRYPAKGLTPKQHEALIDYTQDSFINNNLIVRHMHGESGPDSDDRSQYRHLMNITQKHTLPQISLYHGLGVDPSQISKKTEDGQHLIFHNPGFTSASIDPSVGSAFGSPIAHPDQPNIDVHHVLHIHVPEGHPGFYMGNDDNKSENGHETEALMPAGITYKLVSTPEIYSMPDAPIIKNGKIIGTKRRQLHVYKAHPVPKGEDPHTWQPPQQST